MCDSLIAPSEDPACMLVGLAAFVLILALSATSLGAVHAPKILSEHSVDLHSLEDFIADVLKRAQPGAAPAAPLSQKAKAHAVWQAMADRMYHWCNPVEAPRRRDGGYSDVTDPIKLMNVYGYTLCFCSGPAMEVLWRAAGLEAREFGLVGHVAPEVWYDGAYHYMDVEMKGYFRRPDGRIANIRECGLRPVELMLRPSFPEGFFPLSKEPFRTYLSRMVYAGIVDDGPAWYASCRGQSGHVMNVSLRKGETCYRAWDNVGRFVRDYKRWMAPGEFGTFDCRYGPKDKVSDRTFGNGILIYEPDLTPRTDEYEDGVHAAENVVKTDEGLSCKAGAESGWAVFRFQLPYVIAGDPHRLEQPDTTTDAAVIEFEGAGEADVLISTDEGRTWQATGAEGFGKVDLSRFVERRYGYQLKFVLKAGAVLRRFRSETSFQLAPTSLPGLRKGANRVTFDLAADPYEVMIYDPPMWTTEREFRAAAYRTHNIRWRREWPMAVSTRRRSEKGHVIYELQAPPGKRLRKVSIDVRGSLRHRQWHEDTVELSAAEAEPRNFRQLGSVRGGPYSGHWQRRIHREVDLPRGRDVRKLYVGLDIFSRHRAAVSECRFRLFLEDLKARPGDVGDLVITHGWLEGGKLKTFQVKAPKPGGSYTVRTGEGFQRPVFVCMELPGRAGARALSDPLGLATYKKRPASFYPPEAAGFSNAELLSRLDREGLDRSDTMVEILLRGENRKVGEQVAKMLGYRPVEAVRPLLLKLRKGQPAEHRWRRGLALLDERKAPSRPAFLRRYLPTLKPDAYGLRYIDRIGEIGTKADIPVLLQAMDKVDHVRLKLALAQAAMALGDPSAAETASELVRKLRNPEHRVPIDALLVGHPAHCEPAKTRLLKLLGGPDAPLKWKLLTEVARHARPGRSGGKAGPGQAAIEQLAAEALADEDPWIRLAGLSVLWNSGGGDAPVRSALRGETQTHLKEAYREFLDRGPAGRSR